MTEGSFEEGYRAGWEGVAGNAIMPARPTEPPPGQPRDYAAGFEYGRADAAERFKPSASDHPKPV